MKETIKRVANQLALNTEMSDGRIENLAMKRNRGPQSRPASTVQGALMIRALMVLLLSLSGIESIRAQTAASPAPERKAPTQLLPSTLGDGTTSIESIGPASLLRSADWRVLEDAPVWKEYGLIDLSIRRYRVEKMVLQVELFRHETPAGATGLQSFQRLTRQPGQALAEFATGSFFLRLSDANAPHPVNGRTSETRHPVAATPPLKRLEDALRSTLAPEREEEPVEWAEGSC